MLVLPAALNLYWLHPNEMVHNSCIKYPCELGQEGGLNCRVSTWNGRNGTYHSPGERRNSVCKMKHLKAQPMKREQQIWNQ